MKLCCVFLKHLVYQVHKDWFRHSKVGKLDTQTYRRRGELISLLLFFQKKESRLKQINFTNLNETRVNCVQHTRIQVFECI
jgi:hypothetical protein